MELEDIETVDQAPRWKILEQHIAGGDRVEIDRILENLSPAETALVVSRLGEVDRARLLSILDPDDAADVIHDLPSEQAADIMEDVSPAEAAAIIDLLPADERADLLADVQASEAAAILDAMSVESAAQARDILKYPTDSAGGLMNLEFLAYHGSMTVSQVLHDLQINRKKYTDYEIQYFYVVDESGVLIGVLRMRDLFLAERETRLDQLMLPHPVHVTVETPLDELIQFWEEHSYLGAPVVDASNRLVGILRRADVNEAEGRREKNAFLKLSGIVGGEEFRSMPLLARSFRRLSWLGPNILLNVLAASVIAFYQETLQAVIALAVFLPIISDMSGCSGNQAVGVSIRELSLGLITPSEFRRIFVKESMVGVINGMLLGLLLGGVAFLWKGNPYLGLVIGSALMLNTLLAVLLGGSIPLLLRRMNVDPALASGPILTTVTDLCGFFFVLSFAKAALPLL